MSNSCFLCRVVEEAVLAIGGCIGYYSGDLHKLMEDVGQFKPTVFAGVPRIYERVYTGVFEKVCGLSGQGQQQACTA